MTHDDAFLQAIIDNPEDDGPRLASPTKNIRRRAADTTGGSLGSSRLIYRRATSRRTRMTASRLENGFDSTRAAPRASICSAV
jgi:hypothetical protein